MPDNERLIIFDIVEVDGTYNITTEDSRAQGYGYFGLPSTEILLRVMQEMSNWLHLRKRFDVVFALTIEKNGGLDTPMILGGDI